MKKKNAGFTYNSCADVRFPYYAYDDKRALDLINISIREHQVYYNEYIKETLKNFIPKKDRNNNTEVKRKKQIVDYIIDNPNKFIFIDPSLKLDELNGIIPILMFYIVISLPDGVMSVEYHPQFKLIMNGVENSHPDDEEGCDFFRDRLRPSSAESYIGTITAIKNLTKFFKMPVLIGGSETTSIYYSLNKGMLNNKRQGKVTARGSNILKDTAIIQAFNFSDEICTVNPDRWYTIQYTRIGQKKSGLLPRFKWEIKEIKGE